MHPTQWLLPAKSDTPTTSSSDKNDSEAATEIYDPDVQEEEEDAPKGAFRITVKHLKKVKKYNCKYYDSSFDSLKKLTSHHQKSHKIMYCNLCNRAFNNPTTVKSKEGLWAFIHGKSRFSGLQSSLGITNGNRSHNKPLELI